MRRHLHPFRESRTSGAWPRRWLWKSAMLSFIAPTLLGATSAAPADDLVALINDFRNENRNCNSKSLQSAGPLTPHAGLSKLQTSGADDVKAALRAQDYRPSKMQVLQISGIGNPSSVMDMLKKHYCEPLMDPQYVDVGVSRKANSWSVVLARPVLSPSLKDWPDEGRQILKLTNEARAQARKCGGKNFKAVGPVVWNAKLGAAALTHSLDMASQNYFSHSSKNGDQVGSRVNAQNYAWRAVGENIAAGQGSAQEVVSAWLSSPPHCAGLMGKAFSEMGAAYAIDKSSDTTIYWTQVFATPR